MPNTTFKYSLFRVLREKSIMFWLLIFPIILTTSYSVVIKNIDFEDTLQEIKVGFVESGVNPNYSLFEQLSDNAEQLNIRKLEKDEAYKELEQKKIDAIIVSDYSESSGRNNLNLVVQNMQAKEFIVKTILDRSKEYENIGYRLQEPPIIENINYIEEMPVSSKAKSVNVLTLSMFAMLAMSCLNAMRMGACEVVNHEADQSYFASRLSASALSKGKRFIYMGASSLILQLLFSTIVVTYVVFILDVGLKAEFLRTLLITLVGTISCYFIGTAVGTTIKVKSNVQVTSMTTLNIILSAMAGMMNTNVKYLIDNNLPWLNKINPAAIITNAYYSLYYYEDYEIFNQSLTSMVIIGIVTFFLTLVSLRRLEYDSL